MGIKLTVTLAIALLTFVLAPMASADQITIPGSGDFIIPDGSLVTSIVFLGHETAKAYQVNFQFPGGTGSNEGDAIDGEVTNIMFTNPVANLSLTVLLYGIFGEVSVSGASGVSNFECGNEFPTECGIFNLAFNGSINSLQLGTGDNISGIESMSFTVDAGDPPTSSLILLGVGLIGLLVSSRRKVLVCP